LEKKLGDPKPFIKRDGFTGSALRENKTRILESTLVKAKMGKNRVIATAAVQSN
jgi:1-aminocyclopropane-1-carboxylate deaminase/D-cysteine desulfhydrase-like pyridoxal-dependent ACC family enzyme